APATVSAVRPLLECCSCCWSAAEPGEREQHSRCTAGEVAPRWETDSV
ncbi:MAG: hypothetical protein AVDCRST_MAG57-2769, partial [uncultured Blastococcus sp.]